MTSNNGDLGNNEFIEQAKNGILSLFTASAITLSTIGVDVVNVEPAYAAAPATQTTTTVSSGKNAEKKPADPLASQKSAVEKAKAKVVSTSAATVEAKKSLSTAQAAYTKAADQTTQLSKKAVSSKQSLISLNDSLADAKAKEGRSGNLNALKEVENLATKVGKAKDTLKSVETELAAAKTNESTERKALSAAELTFDKASKAETAAKSEASKAVTTLSQDEKKLAKTQKADAKKKAKQDKKNREAKAKADKARQKLEKKQKKKAAEAKKKADKIAKIQKENKAKKLKETQKKVRELEGQRNQLNKSAKDSISKEKQIESDLKKQKAQLETMK